MWDSAGPGAVIGEDEPGGVRVDPAQGQGGPAHRGPLQCPPPGTPREQAQVSL